MYVTQLKNRNVTHVTHVTHVTPKSKNVTCNM